MSFVGSFREVALTKEASRGVADGPDSGDFISHNAHSFRAMAEKTEHLGANGTIYQRHNSTILREFSQGTIPMILEQSKLWLLGALITGSDPSTTGSGPYTHAYTVTNSNAHQSFSVNYTDPTMGDQVAANGMLNTLNLTASLDNYIEASLEMYGGKTESATYTPSYNTTNVTYFTPDQITFKIADNYAGLGAASNIPLEGLNMTVNKNAEYIYETGTTEPSDIINGRLDIRGDFTIDFEADTYRALGLSNTTKAASFNLTNGDYQLTIELPTIDFQDPQDAEDNDSHVTGVVTFVATDEDATNGVVKVDVIDQTATH